MDLLKLRLKPILDGAFFHSRCVAHVINLAVQVALKICHGLHKTFRETLTRIYNSSNERQANYRRFRKQCGETPLGPCFDNNTRWNSTHNMFVNTLRQRSTLNAFNNMLVERNKSIPILDQEWEQLEELTSFLVVFKDATTILSGVYYPTSPLVLNQIWLMTEKVKEFEFKSCPLFKQTAKVIKKKFIKYFAKLPLVFTCAAALNPVIGVGGVETLITTILQNLDFHVASDPEYVQKEVSKFTTTFKKLYAIYCDKYSQRNPIVDAMSSGSSGTSHRGGNLQMNLFNTLYEDSTKRQRTSAPSSELGQYSALNIMRSLSLEEFQNFDILTWWKEREVQFPILAAMARDLFTIQASTVASESAFSTSGRIISERRSRLTPEAVEVCVCLKDYLDGVERVQHETTLEGDLLGGVEDKIQDEEVDLGLSPPTTELDEGEFEDFEFDADEEDDLWGDITGSGV